MIDNKRSLTTGFNAATAKRNPNSDKRMAIFRNLWIKMDVAILKNKFIILRMHITYFFLSKVCTRLFHLRLTAQVQSVWAIN